MKYLLKPVFIVKSLQDIIALGNGLAVIEQ